MTFITERQMREIAPWKCWCGAWGLIQHDEAYKTGAWTHTALGCMTDLEEAPETERDPQHRDEKDLVETFFKKYQDHSDPWTHPNTLLRQVLAEAYAQGRVDGIEAEKKAWLASYGMLLDACELVGVAGARPWADIKIDFLRAIAKRMRR